MNKMISIRIDEEILKDIDKEAKEKGKNRSQYIIDKILSDNQNINNVVLDFAKLTAELGNIIANDYTEKKDAQFRHNVLKNLSLIHEIINNIYAGGRR